MKTAPFITFYAIYTIPNAIVNTTNTTDKITVHFFCFFFFFLLLLEIARQQPERVQRHLEQIEKVIKDVKANVY